MQARRFCWATALTIVLASVAWVIPGAGHEGMIYERSAIMRGEIWRLWSGHLVHFSPSHLGWNLLVVGLTGAWIELAGFRGGRWLFLVAPLCISLTLTIADPWLQRYGGLSGLATATLVYACLSEWQSRGPAAGWSLAILALVGLKIGYELIGEIFVFANFQNDSVRPAPLSHFSGAGSALLVRFIRAREPTK